MPHQTITHNHNIHHQAASNHAYKCVLLVLFLFLLGFYQSTLAQEPKTVYIEIFANQEQPAAFYELMEMTKAKLLDYGVSLSVISDMPDLKKTLDQNLLVTVAKDSESVLISSLAHFRHELSLSPILYPNYVTPHCCNGGVSVLFNDFLLTENNLDEISGFIAGLGLYQVGEYEACEKQLRSAYEQVPSSSQGRTTEGIKSYINFYRANCAIMRNDLEIAVKLLESSKPILTGEAAINLAWLYLQLGEIDKALERITNLETGKDWDLLARSAQIYNLAFRYDDAITDLTTAIELSPADPTLYTLRGQTYLLLYEWDAVLADYNKALELDPTYADTYYYRGVLFYSILQTGQDMYTAALADFQRYLELAPDGEHAAEATQSAADIQTQINALNN